MAVAAKSGGESRQSAAATNANAHSHAVKPIYLFFIAPLPLRSTCHQVYHRRRDHVLRRAWRAQMAPM